MSFLSARGLVASGGMNKTAFTLEDLSDAVYSAPDMATKAYYGIKDYTYPIREALRISDYKDRFRDRLSHLGSIMEGAKNEQYRGLRKVFVDPFMDITRPDIF